MDEPRALPELPKAWIAPKLVGRTLAFTTTDFDTEANLKHRITEKVGAVQSVEVSGMSLRAVAKALMLNAVEAHT